MYLCPKDTNFFLHILINYCYFVLTKPLGHSLIRILFELTSKSLESEIGANIKPTRYVQWSNFDDFSALFEKSKHCVHMKRHISYQNSSLMSQQHSCENKSWPLDDLEIWPLTFSCYRNMQQNWQKGFKILIFQTKYTFMGWPWPSMVMVSTLDGNYVLILKF